MSPDRRERVKAVFLEALDKRGADREAFLEETCRGDSELRREVLEFLAQSEAERTADFLEPIDLGLAAAADQTTDDPRIGSRIGRYELIERIGTGGMGIVYRARRVEDFEQTVAVKLVKRGMDSEEILRRFRDEMQFLAALGEHSNIAGLLDGGTTEDGLPFFVMEYVEGDWIDRYCDHDTLSVDKRIELFQEVCAAVHFAHQRAVIHRDLKPSNMLVTVAGVPKLIDFGIAKLIDANDAAQLAARTLTVYRVLTPYYASPEQVRGEAISAASDVYSLGVVLYELLTGRRPYRATASRPIEFERMICEQQPRRPSTVATQTVRSGAEGGNVERSPKQVSHSRGTSPGQLARRLSGDLDNILLKALDKNPERRYASARHFSEDLGRHLEGLPVLARPDSFAYRLRKFVGRHRAATVAVLLIVVSLVLGIIGTTSQAIIARRETRRAQALAAAEANALRQSQRNLYVADMNLLAPAWEEPNVGRMIQLLERHRPSPGEEDLRGFEWYYWWRVCHRERMILRGDYVALAEVAFAPDGERFAWSESEHKVAFADAKTGVTEFTLDVGPGAIAAIAFSPNGEIVATAAGHEVRTWDAETGASLGTMTGHEGRVRSVAFSPDGQTLATSGDDGTIAIWDSMDQTRQNTLRGHSGAVWDIAFSPDGESLVSAGVDTKIGLWNAAIGEHQAWLTGHNDIVTSVVFSPDGDKLASGSRDLTIKVWKITEGMAIRTLEGHHAWVNDVDFTPDGERLVSAGGDHTVRLWDASSGEEMAAFKGHSRYVYSVAANPAGRFAASISNDSSLRIWDLANPPDNHRILTPRRLPKCIAMNPADENMAAGSSDGKVRLFELSSARLRNELGGHIGAVQAVAFSPNGRTLASAGDDSIVRLWDTSSGNESAALAAHDGPIDAIAFAPDGAILASASRDGQIILWDVAAGDKRVEAETHDGSIFSLALSPDGVHLAAGGSAGAVTLYDPATGARVAIWHAGTGDHQELAFSPNGRFLAAACTNRSIYVWDMPSGSLVHSMAGHANVVSTLAFSPDGRRIVSAGWDLTIRLWELESGQQTTRLQGHTEKVLSVAFSSDGNTLASSAEDGTIRLWRAAPEQISSE